MPLSEDEATNPEAQAEVRRYRAALEEIVKRGQGRRWMASVAANGEPILAWDIARDALAGTAPAPELEGA